MNILVDPWGCLKYPLDPQGSRDDPKCIFFTLNKKTEQLLLVTYYDTPAGIEDNLWIYLHGQTQ